jgi:hypothetical protein
MRLGPDGSRQRDTWRHAADRGSKAAAAKLVSPPFPEALGYLWLWTLDLLGRSGFTDRGIVPLSYATLGWWSYVTDQHPTPREVRALMELDGIMLDRAVSDGPERDENKTVVDPPWPEKKNG